jgi:glycosyltransferase involved in cell wall biosynthesis
MIPPAVGRDTLVLYDYLLVRGGAEYVTLLLGRELDIAVCVAACKPEVFAPDEVGSVRRLHRSAPPASPLLRGLWTQHVFRRRLRFLADYDQVIYSGLYAPFAVHQHPVGRNILYCHMPPPPFAYDWLEDYLATCPVWLRPLFRRYAARFRRRYAAVVAAMDVVVANSRWVGEQYRARFGVDYQLIHPPCDSAAYHWSGQGGYYLSTARLEPHKRVDLLIEAFLRLPDRRLVIASNGSELPRLQRLSRGAPNIEFVSATDQTTLRRLTGNCIATLCMGKDEPFGIAAVESMAAGKPVIAAAEGGWMESVIHGRTGLLVESPNPDALAVAVRELDAGAALAMRPACEGQAGLFDKSVFLSKMRALLGSAGCQSIRVQTHQ